MKNLSLVLLLLLCACAPKTHYRVAWRVHEFKGQGYCVDRQTAEKWAAEFTLEHPGVEHQIEECGKK